MFIEVNEFYGNQKILINTDEIIMIAPYIDGDINGCNIRFKDVSMFTTKESYEDIKNHILYGSYNS